jgi:phosphate:Na+ symporter
MAATIIGGIGLFLLGMILMTDGLKGLAGDALRQVLSRFVGGRFSALASGAGLTALVQSSSATTLTTIGFVSAGLVTFPQAVGVIFGANLGTTSTGWIVSLLGFKIKMGAIALPLVGVGALVRLLGKGKVANAGVALAGFGLIFVGIETLQGGMQGLNAYINPGSFPGGDLGGRIMLVLIGALMTVVMQSSSAAVATTLTALHAEAITLPQAAALVIGQNIGTTVKVILVSIGASTAVKRTAVAHILFNLVTGIVAFASLPLFILGCQRLAGLMDGDPGVTALAAFHTAFNIVGVLLFLPWLNTFSKLVMRMVPQRGPVLTRNLDSAVIDVGPVAVEAARRTAIDVAAAVFGVAHDLLRNHRRPQAASDMLDRASEAIVLMRDFLGRVSSGPETPREHRKHIATLHAVDHLSRMVVACQQSERYDVAVDDPVVRTMAGRLGEGLQSVLPCLSGRSDHWPIEQVQALAGEVAQQRRTERPAALEQTAAGQLSPDQALCRLEAIQWIDRLGYHVWRIVHHLQENQGQPAPSDTAISAAEPESTVVR